MFLAGNLVSMKPLQIWSNILGILFCQLHLFDCIPYVDGGIGDPLCPQKFKSSSGKNGNF